MSVSTHTPQQNVVRSNEFSAIRLRLASPEDIVRWSSGEVTKPETINYRTQKPEPEGLFSERIFGPVKDWECACGKYKRIRYKGIVCDKCGVEVTRSIVRRERMGHITLVAPVAHIWFLRGVPSNMSLVLDISVQNLEKVIYFAEFIITKVHQDLKQQMTEQVAAEFMSKKKQLEQEGERLKGEVKRKWAEKKEGVEARLNEELSHVDKATVEKIDRLEEALHVAKDELAFLEPRRVISKNVYQDLSLKYGQAFEAGIGAEAILELLQTIDLEKEISSLEKELSLGTVAATKQSRLVRRLKLLKILLGNKIKPEWMILTVLPIIPPDLRPMVPLDGGRYASSDLNDLYRRVINRNNRLKRLMELNAPEVICRNEKRMLQEAIDSLIDNSARHGKTVVASTGQKRMLRSIADTLKGKQGRFRQNLLGKRVDYSGRSVIVVGPYLRLHQCGLPKIMALELFKPFVISKLIQQGLVHNVRSAARLIETGRKEVWDILEDVTKGAYVLLNRAPTLHRLSVQAFQPVLIEGKAIQIHPLVCPAFNADFDGDQMAVHVPLTREAQAEARDIMLSSRNILKPATGEPITIPHQDIIWGSFYMTMMSEARPESRGFASKNEAWLAYDVGMIQLQEKIIVRMKDGHREETTVGRIIFNSIVPDELRDYSLVYGKKQLKELVRQCYETFGFERTAPLLDDLKDLALKYLTRSGLSWGIDDLPTLNEKRKFLDTAEAEIEQIETQYEQGLLTAEEKHARVIEIWARTKNLVTKAAEAILPSNGPIYTMITSGARGSMSQITQMMGMKGSVTNPQGEIIELPVKNNFKEGLDVLEYFISTHGTRKGLSDIALRTANAGYLTRRLIDVSQNIIVTNDDCGDTQGLELTQEESDQMGESLSSRLVGRVLVEKIIDPKTKKTLAAANEVVTTVMSKQLEKVAPPRARIFSVLTCRTIRGICKKCYGWDLGYNKMVEMGAAVGVVAAQSIGEPGTQLTMRTFHTGGVAEQDITQGLPRVEEIFENRPVKKKAHLAFHGGVVSLEKGEGKTRLLVVTSQDVVEETYDLRSGVKPLVKKGQKIEVGAPLFKDGDHIIEAKQSGVVQLVKKKLSVVGETPSRTEYVLFPNDTLLVKEGEVVLPGYQMTEGSLSLEEVYRLKGKEAVQRYVIREIQAIYSSQGQKVNDKHIETIGRQMFSRVMVTSVGDTALLPGEVVAVSYFREANLETIAKGGEPAECKELLLGITKVSLSTESFLAAASFQETARVLINAAITGKVDHLRGLKENVIIGRLVPAGTGFVNNGKAEVEEVEELTEVAAA